MMMKAAGKERTAAPKAVVSVPQDGLGAFICDNDINVKGSVNHGTLTADFDLLVAAFGDPKDTVLAGVDWRIMGSFDGANLIAQVCGSESSNQWSVKGVHGSSVLAFINAIVEKTVTDMTQSHVPPGAEENGLDTFRVDNDLNIKAMSLVGGVDMSYNMVRYTFGPPKQDRNTGKIVEWRLIGMQDGVWVPVMIRQPSLAAIADTEIVMEWQVHGMSSSAYDWAQTLVHSQKAHMHWHTGTKATSFLESLQEDAERAAGKVSTPVSGQLRNPPPTPTTV